MFTMKKLIGISLILLSLLINMSGCSEESKSKNLEQIYVEEGVPVRTMIITSNTFSEKLEYNAVLEGKNESSAFALITDKIDKIYYKVGDLVKKDEVVLSFPTDNPAANYYQAKVSFENAQATYKRMNEYFESGGISRQDFENSEAAFKVAEANWESVQKMVLVRAPIAGMLTRLHVQQSDNINAEDPLFTIADEKYLKAKIWVSDININEVQKGQKATAIWNDVSIEGEVVEVDISMNQAKKAFGVVIVFDNSNRRVRGGITAKIVLETYSSSGSIVVERKNIFNESGTSYVFLHSSGKAIKRIVETGKSSDLDVEILSGLTEGDELIVEGQILLDENKKVKIVNN